MFLLTNLFFNKTGNQSLYETINGYSKHFEVYFISTADLKDTYYYSTEEISKKMPDINFFFPKIKIYDFSKNILNRMKNKERIQQRNETSDLYPISLQKTGLLINQEIKIKNIFAFYYRNYKLYMKAKELIKRGIKPDFICAYEIGGVIPALKIKKEFPNIKIFSKFQGTVLGPVLENISEKKVSNTFKLDIKAMEKIKHFDGAIMTNDGTNGDKVLEYFKAKKVLFLPNGIATDFANEVQQRNYRKDRIPENKDKIKLYTLSRIIPWKRVHLSVEIMNTLVNVFKNKKFELNIYGKADDVYLLYINNLIKKYSLDNFIKIHGPVEYEKVAKIHYDNDILLSLYTTTNATNPVYEAIYIRNIVITLRDNNLKNILKSNPFVVYFENEVEEEKISKQIATYLNNFCLKEYYINCFKKNEVINDVFSWEERIQKEIEFIEAL